MICCRQQATRIEIIFRHSSPPISGVFPVSRARHLNIYLLTCIFTLSSYAILLKIWPMISEMISQMNQLLNYGFANEIFYSAIH